jgi:hypothetical protein
VFSICTSWGSSSNSVINGRTERQHPGTQEFGARATVHRTPERFQSIDSPFGLAVAPALGQRLSDGVDISPDRASEAVDRVKPGLLRIVESDVEFMDVFASKTASEAFGEPAHGGAAGREFGEYDLH